MSTFNGDTKLTAEIICPYCGYKDTDSWEYEPGDITCESCKQTFIMERDVDVCYTTCKKE